MPVFKDIPDAKKHLKEIKRKMQNKEPFTFIRFSDGETEILRNRYLEIAPGKTVFRGKESKNKFPQFDSKKFDPSIHQNIRNDLFDSSRFKGLNYYKGIPTSHNKAFEDKDFMLELNGEVAENITFADLFLNSNYETYISEIVPLFEHYSHVCVVANFRATPIGILSKASHIKVPDNFFSSYDDVLADTMKDLLLLGEGTLVLSSASSLSNIIGYKLFQERKNITFLDIGTSINDLLSLDNNIRSYQKQKNKSFFRRLFYKKSKNFEIKW